MATSEPYHFEVEGPGRDYDYTAFCQNHYDEALTFASEWMDERVDVAEVGDSVTVTVRVKAGPPECCHGEFSSGGRWTLPCAGRGSDES